MNIADETSTNVVLSKFLMTVPEERRKEIILMLGQPIVILLLLINLQSPPALMAIVSI